MKVEIELSELAKLKNDLDLSRQVIDKITSERDEALRKSNDKWIASEIERASHEATEIVLTRVLKHLGFDFHETGWMGSNVKIDFPGFDANKERISYTEENIQVSYGANITQSFKHAFIRIGIKPPSEL